MAPAPVFCPPNTQFVSYYPDLNYVFEQQNIVGESMIAKASGAYWFTGYPNDTFVFKPQEPVGARWAFKPSSTDTAEVIARSTAILYGVLDSVVEIRVNAAIYRISKHHGFVAWNFFYPLVANTGSVEMWKGSLFGISEDGFGRQVPGYSDFYDFSVGDQFKISQNNLLISGSSSTKVDLWEITGPASSTLPLRYNAQRRSRIGTNQYQENLNDVFYCPQLPVFDRLPGEFPMQRANIQDEVFLYYYKVHSTYNGRILAHYLNPMSVDTCMKLGYRASSIGWKGSMMMGEGLGQLKWDWEAWVLWDDEWKKSDLICYEKTNENWNGPCETGIVGLGQPQFNPTFSLFPNPADKGILIEFEESGNPSYSLSLINAQGAVVWQFHSDGQPLSLSTESLPSGIYQLQVVNGFAEKTIRRLVIAH